MKLTSDPLEGHGELSLAEAGRLQAVLPQTSETPDGTAAYVVSVHAEPTSIAARARFREICALVGAVYPHTVGAEQLKLFRPDPRTLIGSGSAAAVAARAREAGATLLVVDAPLSPSQHRNLEDATGLSVSDREVVILGVFRKHARTRAARIQVEIAELAYLRPRIRGLGLDMDQQAGGAVTGRGAGETASELLARQLDDRLVRLRRMARKLERQRAEGSKQRSRCARVALVGYTNAGKTALMNALCGTELSSVSQPFETLDTTSRALSRHGSTVVLHDTVGFIRDLPERLRASFASTLAEVRDATLLAIVVDLSDPEWPTHLEVTEAQLDALGAADIPRQVVLNKADAVVGPVPIDRIEDELADHPWVVVSALDPDAVEDLKDQLLARAREDAETEAEVFVPYADTARMAVLYGEVRVLESEARDDGIQARVAGPHASVARLGEDA